MSPILEVQNLKVGFPSKTRDLIAVDDISFSVMPGETLGLVGESGCGKSLTSLAMMRLLPKSGKIFSGEVRFNNQNLISLTEKEMRKIRGNQISMIFQDPMTALNPVFTCGHQVEESIFLHKKLSKKQVKEKALHLFESVGISDPEKRMQQYPHELSGGMRQRVMIAIALSCDPKVLIADEPTTALDVTIQAQILELLKDLQKKNNMAVVLITHDLGVVAETCDQVFIMYAGKMAEFGQTEDIFASPKNPYTQGLLGSIPHFNSNDRLERLPSIPGNVPSLQTLPQGCRFQTRCSQAHESCSQQPPVFQFNNKHFSSCHLHTKDKDQDAAIN